MVDRLGGNRHGMAHVTLLAVALAEVPLVFQFVQRRVEVGSGKAFTQLDALGLVCLAVEVLDVGGVRQHRARRFQPDAGHRLAKQRAILCHVDGGGFGADHLDIVAVEHAHALQRKRGVQRRLAAHGRQQRIRTLLGDDFGDDFGGDRLDIGGVGKTPDRS